MMLIISRIYASVMRRRKRRQGSPHPHQNHHYSEHHHPKYQKRPANWVQLVRHNYSESTHHRKIAARIWTSGLLLIGFSVCFLFLTRLWDVDEKSNFRAESKSAVLPLITQRRHLLVIDSSAPANGATSPHLSMSSSSSNNSQARTSSANSASTTKSNDLLFVYDMDCKMTGNVSATAVASAYHNLPSWESCDYEMRHGPIGAWIFFYVFCTIICFIALAIICDDFFVPSLEAISEKLNLSEDVAGATFMAAGSSAPELFTSVAAVAFNSDVGIGTITGSALFNMLVIIALTAVFAGKVLMLDWRPMARDSFFYVFSIIWFIYSVWDTKFQIWEAIIMLIIYTLYIVTMVFNSRLMNFLKNIVDRCKKANQKTSIEPIEKANNKSDEGVSKFEQSESDQPKNKKLVKSNSIFSENEVDTCAKSPPMITTQQATDDKKLAKKLSIDRRLSRISNTSSTESLRSQESGHTKTFRHNRRRNSLLNNIAAVPVHPVSTMHSRSSIKTHQNDSRASIKEISCDTRLSNHVNATAHHEENESQLTNNISIIDTTTTFEKLPDVDEEAPQMRDEQMGQEDYDDDINDEINDINDDDDDNQSEDAHIQCCTCCCAACPPIRGAPPRLPLAVTDTFDSSDASFSMPPPSSHNLQSSSEAQLSVAATGNAIGNSTSHVISQQPVHMVAATTSDAQSSLERNHKQNSLNSSPQQQKKQEQHTQQHRAASHRISCAQYALFILKWILFVLAFPFLVCFSYTIPDCSPQPPDRRRSKLYLVSFLMSVLWIAGISFAMVTVVAKLGCIVQIDSFVMSLVVLAAGTSLPDLISSIVVARDGYGDMAVSNAIGSNVFDINLGLGLPFLIRILIDGVRPFDVFYQNERRAHCEGHMLLMPHAKFGFILMGIVLICQIIFVATRFTLNKVIGVVFFLLYIIFLVYAFCQEFLCNQTGKFNC